MAIATLFLGFNKYYQTSDFLSRVDVRAIVTEVSVNTTDDPSNGYTALSILLSNRGNRAVYLDSIFLRVEGKDVVHKTNEEFVNGQMTMTVGSKLEPNDFSKVSYEITNNIRFFNIFKYHFSKVKCYLDFRIKDVNLNIYNESIYLGALTRKDGDQEISGIEISNMMKIYSDPLSLNKKYLALHTATSNRLKRNRVPK
ncbi:hypothetical protein [Shewanella atlantica]|uniref:hypothetical protein n=1 Tax=Shewanella atlantica TaxID=271099 RepID=UPI00373682F2